MAIAPDGSVAGVSDVRVDDSDPAYGQIGITIVDPAHRGKRLGLALKTATHDLAVATWPELVVGRHLQRRGQHLDERRQRGAGLPHHRDAAGAAEEAVTSGRRTRRTS